MGKKNTHEKNKNKMGEIIYIGTHPFFYHILKLYAILLWIPLQISILIVMFSFEIINSYVPITFMGSVFCSS